MKKIFFIIIIFALQILSNKALADIVFDIKNQPDSKTKILFVGFDSDDTNLKADIFEISERIRRNLKTTNLFEIIKNEGPLEVSVVEESKIIQQKDSKGLVEMIPDFEKYNKAQISAILVAQFNYDINGNLELRLRFWDVLDQRQIFGKFYSASKDNYKKLANTISDEIFKDLTGEKQGHFDSKIVYVSESGSIKKRIKKIAMVDFDGENRRFLTDGSDLVLTPIFSKKPNEIFYLSYQQNRPAIFALDVKKLISKKVGGFRGTTYAANIHPQDPNLILLSAIIDGNSDIYEMNISQNIAKRLTKNPAIDTTASYSNDAKKIAFISDRASGQQIYLMNENGSDVVKISRGEGNYAKPEFSPDGTMIAFTKINNGRFHIGTMSPDGRNERLLTSGYLVEGAKWSPNGRYLIYSKKIGQYGKESIPRLYIIDVVSGFEYELPLAEGEGASDPAWASFN